MKVWRINVQTQSLSIENCPPHWKHLGGRGLIAQVLLDEVPGGADPLGPRNKLIFAPGLLVGHRLSSCDRISIGTKSPLTNGVKEANAGGRTGYEMARLGVKVLIIEGQAPEGKTYLLHLKKEGAEFLEAASYHGLGVYDAAKELHQQFGPKVAIAMIGPGGEMQLRAAGIQNVDKDGIPSRISARGGVGAVMGAKGLKAIVIDAEDCDAPELADPDGFKEAKKAYTKAVLEHPQSIVYKEYGTAAMVMMTRGFGSIPTCNFSAGDFELSEAISGETLRDELLKRGGKANPSHACMAGCVIQCSNIFTDSSGEKEVVSPLEYETIGLMGSNLGIGDLDEIAQLNWEVNDLGLDSIDVGAALGVAAEAGLFEFGDAKAALALIKEIREGTPTGRMLGNGAALTGKVLGIRRVPVVKGQAMAAYEPRVIKGTGVTYATSPQGADHTCGLTIRAEVDHQNPEGQAELSRISQIKMAGYDSLGACIFAGFGFASAPTLIADLVQSIHGTDAGSDILLDLGRETLELERAFNHQAGFTKEDDRLPEWMYEESVPPIGAVFDVPDEDLDNVFNWK